MKNNISKLGFTALAAAATVAGTASLAQAQSAQVYLNGQPLRLSTAPTTQNGRVLVPMREIFESLGATVSYNDLTQAIGAQRGTTTVKMTLGSRLATVNTIRVTLDVPAQASYGRTMVPLRFVSEALGAKVDYNPVQRIVAINSEGANAFPGDMGNGVGGGTQVGGFRQITLPAATVIPVTLDQDISSATATRGQSFTATVVSAQEGDNEFPVGTRIEGRVVEASKRTSQNPGVLDLRFRTAVLPDGQRVDMQGRLVQLDNESVVNQDGRIIARENDKNDTTKVIGIGAGAGYLIGRLLKKDGLVSALIGAAGGYLFDRSRNNSDTAEARLEAGTRLGVRVKNPVTFRATNEFYEQRATRVRL